MKRPTLQVCIESQEKTTDEVRLEDLNTLCSRLAKVLKATEHAVSGTSESKLDYRLVGLSHGSALLDVQPFGEAALEWETAKLFEDTVYSLEKGGELDSRLDRHHIEAYQQLGDLPRVKLTVGSMPISDSYRHRAKDWLNREVVSEGSIRGLVKRIDVSKKPFHIDLFPIGAKRRVACNFAEPLLEHARRALGRTATVYGRVVYWGREAAPVRVEISRIEVKETGSSVQFTDLLGSFSPDATGGLPAVDFVRSLREQD